MNQRTSPITARAFAALVALSFVGAPLLASAQQPSAEAVDTVKSLTVRVVKDITEGNASDFAELTAPDFALTLPNGNKLATNNLFHSVANRNLGKPFNEYDVAVDSVSGDDQKIVEQVTVKEMNWQALNSDIPPSELSTHQTMTWVNNDGKWQLESDQIEAVHGPGG